ncbi:MAG TPA: VOC family protein [Nocardioidaceae bacterium]|nr:VOC family protein [Nocardioidaceae bacterium]
MSGIRGLSGWLGVVLDASDPVLLAHFYRDLLGWPIATEEPGWATMGMPGHPANLAFQREEHYVRPTWPADPAQQQMMLHLDIGVRELDPAVRDALALGATLADYQPQDDVRVMLDPAGHPFCLYVDSD